MVDTANDAPDELAMKIEPVRYSKWYVIRLRFVVWVVLAFAIAAAVAVPNLLEAGRHRNQSNPVAAVKEVGSTQNMYHRTDWDGDGVLEYAASFPQLYYQKDVYGNEVKRISEALALATEPALALHGYYFVDITAHETDGQYVDARGNQRDDYGICAVPARYPRSGRATYIMDAGGTVYAKDTRGRPVTIFPASPRRDSWEVAE